MNRKDTTMVVTPAYLKTADGRTVFGAELSVDPNSVEWRPSVSQVREAIMSYLVTGLTIPGMPLLPEANDYRAEEPEVERTGELCRAAVLAGRFIDAGHLPNKVIMECAVRGGEMWNHGAIRFPFYDPWVLYHTWDHDVTYREQADEILGRRRAEGPAIAVYLVWATDDETFEVCELQPMRFGNEPMLVIGDRGIFRVPDDRHGHWSSMAPSMMRFVADDQWRSVQNLGKSPYEAASSNIGDPVMACALILATRGIARETIVASDKLQRARAKNRKPPIPNYDKVHTAPYVTAILARGKREKGNGLGGHHASPQFHIRRGHPRDYATGKSIWIMDTLVNATEDQRSNFKANRSHYVVR